jgi:hypothetical protein
MAVLVYRVYNDDDFGTGKEFEENHFMSIVADEKSAKYVFAKDAEVLGLDDQRILDMKESLWAEETPTTPKEWAEIAYYRIKGDTVVVEDYKDLSTAISAEEKLLVEAKETRDDLDDIGSEDDGFEVFLEDEDEAVTAAAGACPPATQDIVINLSNREKAIKDGGYGPLNPAEPNEEFWQEKATRWSVSTEEAKKSLCGNCVMFITTTEMKNCIAQGIEQGGSGNENAWDAINAAELGYCEAFDFKCAASRTCNAWVTGGPIDDSKNKE